jgi:hypothetical protein
MAEVTRPKFELFSDETGAFNWRVVGHVEDFRPQLKLALAAQPERSRQAPCRR